jgi:lysophospholipase L1-like esterase
MRRALLLAVVATLGPGAGAAMAEDVLVVGDSLEVGTGPHLKRELAGREVQVDARTGRPSPEGLQVLRSLLRPGHKVVVFDLGTNDDPSRPAVLRANLAGALSLAGDRCLVISTLRRPPLNGVPVDAMNAEIERLRAVPNVIVVDWHGFTEERPSLIGPDGVHATPEGYVQRAAEMANGVELCGDLDKIKPPRVKRQAPRPQSQPRARPLRLNLGLGPLGEFIAEAVARVEAATEAVAAVLLPEPPEPVLGAPSP